MRSALLATLLILCSCGPSLQSGESTEVTLSVEPASVSPGQSVTLVLSNGSAAEVGYNLCASGMERLVNGAWSLVPSDRMCTMELRTLAPGAEARYELEIAGGTESGEYRFFTSVDRVGGGQSGPVRSGTVRVG